LKDASKTCTGCRNFLGNINADKKTHFVKDFLYTDKLSNISVSEASFKNVNQGGAQLLFFL
jgi:hypothetical protein